MYCEPKELILKSIFSSLLSFYWENPIQIVKIQIVWRKERSKSCSKRHCLVTLSTDKMTF